MSNRYLYLDKDGKPQGPYWLSNIRTLYQRGDVGPDTPICIDGSGEWDDASTYPEITSSDEELPAYVTPSDSQSNSLSKRTFGLWIWILILLCAVFMWVVNEFLIKKL